MNGDRCVLNIMEGGIRRTHTHDRYVLISWLVIQTAVPVYETPRRNALQNRGLLPWQYQESTGYRVKPVIWLDEREK